MKEFDGHDVTELGRKLDRFPQDVIPYNPVELPSQFVGPIGDPHKIPYRRDCGTLIEHHSGMPRVKGSVHEIAYKVANVSDREADVEEQMFAEKWITGARWYNRGLGNLSMSRALKWTAGCSAALGVTTFVLTRF